MAIDTILADHRSLTAERRRDVMRMRLIEAGVHVFAAQGQNGVVIADVIKAAGVSRGSFYNYYRTIEDLLADACHELSNEVVLAAIEATAHIPDDPQRFAASMHHLLAIGEAYPVFGRFVGQLGLGLLGPQLDLGRMVQALLMEGQSTGAFHIVDLDAVSDALQGTMISALSRNGVVRPATLAYRRAAVSAMLRILAIDPTRADALAAIEHIPLALPRDALLVLAQNHASAAKSEDIDA